MGRNLTLKLTPAQHTALLNAISLHIDICEDEISSEDEAKYRNKWIGEKRALQNIKMWK
jgi:hypothetical protein